MSVKDRMGLASTAGLPSPRAPSYLYSSFLGYVTTGYIEPRTHDLGNWSPRVVHSRSNMNKARRHPLTRLRPYVETILSKHYQGNKKGSFLHKKGIP